tara:strand:+ start:430 stop:912 length:483 start_codon:yes stop_codon:yes gene_type:complete
MNFNLEKENLIKIILQKKIKILIAESLTGGQLAAEFSKIAGASNFFEMSFVCYTESSKSIILGIEKEIKKYGVVSKNVADSMVNRIYMMSKVKNKLAISCTGLAGPSGLPNIPLGTVYFAIKYKNIKIVEKKCFTNKNRQEVISSTIKEIIKTMTKVVTF